MGYHYVAGQYGNEQIFPEAPTHQSSEEMKKHLAELKVLLEKRPAAVPTWHMKMCRSAGRPLPTWPASRILSVHVCRSSGTSASALVTAMERLCQHYAAGQLVHGPLLGFAYVCNHEFYLHDDGNSSVKYTMPKLPGAVGAPLEGAVAAANAVGAKLMLAQNGLR